MTEGSKNGIVKILFSFLTTIALLFNILGTAEAPAPRDEAKNVIFMIGDGMGENHLNWTKAAKGIDTLNMETMTLRGQSETRSSSSAITDSAAGGTALACGVRTTNGCIGVYNYDVAAAVSHPKSLTELAHEMGKKTGVVTTDSTAGATPASFSAHTSSRNNDKDITNQQIASPFDLIWGKSSGCTDASKAAANGWQYVTTRTELLALTPGTRSFAQFDNDMWAQSVLTGDTPLLSEMTGKAIELLSGTEEGFFLMVEGAHIDKNSHSNEEKGMQDALEEFDKAIGIALDFAKADGNTLVIVTADHETGGITLKDGAYTFTKTSHSGANVPLLVYGCDNFIENGEAVMNKEVALFTALAMGAKAEEFPVKG